MKSIIPKDQDFDLWILLFQARDALHKARNKELRKYGISGIEAGTLFYIKILGKKATPVNLSKWLLREQHTVSTLLSRMEKKSLIKRVKDPDRQKGWTIILTDEGEKAYSRSAKRDIFRAAMSPLTKSERLNFESYLRKVRDKAIMLEITEPNIPYP
jgi:DNA-binding MarR family transcriptional regulator